MQENVKEANLNPDFSDADRDPDNKMLRRRDEMSPLSLKSVMK